ncbi:MAG: hypothetical protein O3C40_27700 [Planctomycetota bacterium]|nr:hypothetical protein [Planctomycetota bacterium]
MSVQNDDTEPVNSATEQHAHRQTTGSGHVDQGRFKSFPVQDEDRHIPDNTTGRLRWVFL